MSNVNIRMSSNLHNDDAPRHHEFTIGPWVTHWLNTTPTESKDKPCTVSSLEVDARVRGIYAEVTQTITIANPNRRPISTDLSIPLPDRAVVCGYALDIDGQMVDGVVVPKEKARVIFETEQRRMADPGLVEAVRGNVYNTRVYPIQPLRTRSVRLSYIAPLILGTNDSAILDLPMPQEHLDRRTMRIAVEKLDEHAPRISGLSGTTIEQAEHDWSVQTEESDLTPSEPVRVILPSLPESFVLLERDNRNKIWFCASSRVTEQADDNDATCLRSITVLWDASGSRATVDHTREIELLRAYASAPNIEEITLVVFANYVREVQSFSSADELVQHVMALYYDGGTAFLPLARCEALSGKAQEGIAAGSACVLFTDGLDTLGRKGFSLPNGLSVLTVMSGTARDAEAMRQSCRGPVLDITQAPGDAGGLVAALRTMGRFSLASITSSGVADVCDVSSATGSRRAIIGRLTGEEALLKVGPDETELKLCADDARRGRVLSRAWAARRITLLSVRADENAEELLALGRRFGMASPATSLLVLETYDQYLHYEVEPPRALRQMRLRYRARMMARMRHPNDSKVRWHRNLLAESWKELMDWWQTDYSSRSIPSMDPGDTGALSGFDGSFDGLRRSIFAAPTSAPTEAFADAMPCSAPEPSFSMFAEEGIADSVSAASVAEDGTSQAPMTPSMNVKIKGWMPDTPYLNELDKALVDADIQAARDAYLEQRKSYNASPSFYLDCAGWFLAQDDTEFGVSVLTNLAEMRIEDAGLLRVMAWRLREADMLNLALTTLRRVQRLRSEDSQSYRDLALVLSELARKAYDKGRTDTARTYTEEAGELYRKIALTAWERRPIAISLFAVEEYNVLRAWSQEQTWETAPELPSLGEDLEGVLDCDLRIMLAWDADETDVDIHVTEPSGEEAYYGHRRTYSGGRVSEDITDGFGPELYEIRSARPGMYRIRAHYYGSHQQTVFGPATCTLTVYSDWGRSHQTQQITTTRLNLEHEMVEVGTAFYGEMPEVADEADEPGSTNLSSIEVGMTRDEVAELVSPAEFKVIAEEAGLVEWTLPNGHRLVAIFEDDLLVRAMESMPWGDSMILTS